MGSFRTRIDCLNSYAVRCYSRKRKSGTSNSLIPRGGGGDEKGRLKRREREESGSAPKTPTVRSFGNCHTAAENTFFYHS